eukprot:TRINITY_DN11238_c0_g1_i1.p1 TRINITY_DN11238_c0_g1~~TRINITY_DN11238_c0_g1_i1.p1  ORF type:complete len:764 (-),score=130.11 TRINITY_DN11238_c0_g1_i1:122-2413(-)
MEPNLANHVNNHDNMPNQYDHQSEHQYTEKDLLLITPFIGELIQLTYLDLSESGLSSLPPEFGRLKNVINVNLRNNRFTMLPSWFYEAFVGLEVLDLSGNLFEVVPDDILMFDQLETLDMSRNCITEFGGGIIHLDNLFTLNLNCNQLTKFPVIPSVQILNLRNNLITEIPHSIISMNYLMILNIENNKLSTLPSIASEMDCLTHLRISGNKKLMSKIPEYVMYGGTKSILNLFLGQDVLKDLDSSEEFNEPRNGEMDDVKDTERQITLAMLSSLGQTISTARFGDSIRLSNKNRVTSSISRKFTDDSNDLPVANSNEGPARKRKKRSKTELNKNNVEDIFLKIPMVHTSDNFFIEGIGDDEHFDIAEEDSISNILTTYTRSFFPVEHSNFIGVSSREGPMVISVQFYEEDDEHRLLMKILLRTAKEDLVTEMIIPTKAPKKLKEFKKIFEHQFQWCAPMKLKKVKKNIDWMQMDLVSMDHSLLKQEIKVGLVYVRPHQKNENKIYKNRKHSKKFSRFLNYMGDRIDLMGWTKFNGGLNTEGNAGDTSIYYKNPENIEFMFHVSTLLPQTKEDNTYITKKRHIGNDVVVIVFLEVGATFYPDSFCSSYNHVFILIQPINYGNDFKVRVTVISRGCYSHPPIYPESIFELDDEFRGLLYRKIMNAELQVYHNSDTFVEKMESNRYEILRGLYQKHYLGKIDKPQAIGGPKSREIGRRNTFSVKDPRKKKHKPRSASVLNNTPSSMLSADSTLSFISSTGSSEEL